MNSHFEQRLAQLKKISAATLLAGSRIGLEKETLRVNPQGSISQELHPEKLGAALTNPYITTDYSEALLELVTPPCDSVKEAVAFLADTQKFVFTQLDDEMLWATSMPCVVAGETSIPIAKFGSSNAGMMKTVYRRGLGYRYGRVMQVIAGVHFNYSLSKEFWQAYHESEESNADLQSFINDNYFGILRNLQRLGWLVPYLFGASPAVCKSFLGETTTSLQDFDENTYYEEYATSLRMGDIGYQNNKENESGIKADYDDLDKYIDSLKGAISTACPEYEKIGIEVDGEYRQLNANILQIENEYYSTVRPKQVPNGNEKPVAALKNRGVEYIELRSLDVNAFEPLGVSESQLYFLEAFVLFCLLTDSLPIDDLERGEIDQNELDTAHRGRDPNLSLQRNGETILLKDWALEVVTAMQGVCELLDAAAEGQPYQDALAVQTAAIHDPELTPSAIMLKEMRENEEGFYHFARRMSVQHSEYFSNIESSPESHEMLIDTAKKSVLRQQEIEAADKIPFTEYLENYLNSE
ncbi:MAG: glutamate--cysteine ligase [Sulfuriflexus sp.]|nr:glutamate--cysteine ligase [Sulfuriflexus sp.]